MSSKKQRLENDLLEWRRSEELEMYASGKSMTTIAESLKIDVSTVSRDLELLRKQSKDRQIRLLEEDMPFKHSLRVAAMDKAIKELWSLYYKETDSRNKKGLLDSITDALIKQAAIDSDSVAVGQALKKIARIKEMVKVQGQEATESG